MAELVRQFASGIYNLILGLFTTGKHLGRHAVTVQYPKERWTMPERSRGMVVLLTDHETGKLNCTACLLCMRACPSGAIEIEYEKDEKNRRQLKEFRVDFQVCCFCGLCEEACNFSAIKLAPKYEFPEFERGRLLWDSKKLQAMGLDVPYEKRKRAKDDEEKRPAVHKPVTEPAEAATSEQPAETAPTNPDPGSPPGETATPSGASEPPAGEGGGN